MTGTIKRRGILPGGLVALAALHDSFAQAAASNDGNRRGAVVELFQNQGCS